jgi:hypothetical protein
MNKDIQAYNDSISSADKKMCMLLAREITKCLPEAESKIWHGHPVWFLDGNPIVGYDKLKDCVRLLFWSGQSFNEPGLQPEGSFKAAEVRYTAPDQVNTNDLKRWLKKSKTIQWDYKNIVKRKGKLVRLDSTKTISEHDERIAKLTFASVYPSYLAKIERKGRTKEELHQVIEWLTGFDIKKLKELTDEKVTFETFFKKAKLNPNAHLITGVICGYRIEEIKNPLTKQVRYLDKLVDELAKGKTMEKILRK